MNEAVKKMKQIPGLYAASRPGAAGYAFVLVEEDGTVHQIKLISVNKKADQVTMKLDGILDDSGWCDDTIVSGPYSNYVVKGKLRPWEPS